MRRVVTLDRPTTDDRTQGSDAHSFVRDQALFDGVDFAENKFP